MNRTRRTARPRFWKLLLLAALTVWLAANPLAARAQDPTGKEANLVTPPDPGGPTEVFVDLYGIDVLSIDERDETFEVDGRVYLDWYDERQAFDPDAFGAERKIYQGQTAQDKLKDEIWWPEFEIVDARGPREILNSTLTVDYDGLVSYTERFRVLIVQPYDLDYFPFDEHTISLRLEPFYYGGDEVVFLESEEQGSDLTWTSNEWELSEPRTIIDSGSLEGLPEDEYAYAGAQVEIDISRLSAFYFSNVILPLLLIVAISWVVFWMDYGTMTLADRLSVSFTGVLTIVAFDFVTSDSLPRLSYPTILDDILTVSYIFLALTILENVIGHILARSKRSGAANILDLACRFLFPIGYYGILAFIFLGIFI